MIVVSCNPSRQIHYIAEESQSVTNFSGPSGYRIVDGMIAVEIHYPESASALEIDIDIDVQGLAGLVENDVSHVPRRRNSKGNLKDLSTNCSSSNC